MKKSSVKKLRVFSWKDVVKTRPHPCFLNKDVQKMGQGKRGNILTFLALPRINPEDKVWVVAHVARFSTKAKLFILAHVTDELTEDGRYPYDDVLVVGYTHLHFKEDLHREMRRDRTSYPNYNQRLNDQRERAFISRLSNAIRAWQRS